jgi:uncharacterized protein (DUF1330 family)
MSGHSMLATMAGMKEEDLAALRSGATLSTPRLEALRVFTKRLLEARGAVSEADLLSFLDAGYRRRQAMEVPLGIAFKTMSNFSHRLQPVAIDEPVKPFEWSPPAKQEGTKLLVTGWVHEDGEEALVKYQTAAGPIMGKHGGRPILKAKPVGHHIGDGPDLVVLVEFPSAQAAKAAFDDPDYQKLLSLRDQAFARLEVTDLGAGA